jgi:DNA-binding transcriptional ArsR family regulator
MQIDRTKIVEDENRKNIEKYLATKQKATINQISSDLDISWATARKHLDYLESIGRVHKEEFRNSIVYFFNGDGKWKDKVWLTKNHLLFLDTFVSTFNKPFIRIKEVKREGDDWKHVGDIMITKEKLHAVIKFLQEVELNINVYS